MDGAGIYKNLRSRSVPANQETLRQAAQTALQRYERIWKLERQKFESLPPNQPKGHLRLNGTVATDTIQVVDLYVRTLSSNDNERPQWMKQLSLIQERSRSFQAWYDQVNISSPPATSTTLNSK